MTLVERKIIDFIKKHLPLFIFIGATLIGLIIRYKAIDFQSDDFNSFLNGWWGIIKNGGASSLSKQVGNYNIPYQIIIFLMTRLPVEALTAYKLLSIVFDIALAFSAALVVSEALKRKFFSFVPALTYTLVFCSITVIFNSAFWAQCDSIYVTFILLAIYMLRKNSNIWAFVFLGLSLAFKLQVVFILPLFLYYYFSSKKISVLHFFIIPVVDILVCLPVVFMGRNFLDIFKIYVDQTDYGKLIQMNCPNIYAFMCNGSDMQYYYLFKPISIWLTFLVLAVGLCFILYKKVDLTNIENFLFTAVWTSFSCLMFLSSMHERYSYLLDILLILYVVVARKHYAIAVISGLVSLRGYCYYLFGNYEVLTLQWTAVIFVGLYAYTTYVFFKDVIINGKKQEDAPAIKKKARSKS